MIPLSAQTSIAAVGSVLLVHVTEKTHILISLVRGCARLDTEMLISP